MKQPDITLRLSSTGVLYPAADNNYGTLVELRKRIDVDGDMPRLAEACGVKAGDLVIDAGGFIGDTAMPFLNVGASVIAFEPFFDSFTCMLYNTRAHSGQMDARNVPVGNGDAVRLIYDCPGTNHGMRRVSVCNPDSADAVYTFKLDSLLRVNVPKVKLIKVDVEGSEIPTLLGAAELIERDKPFLYVEVYDGGLANLGYDRHQLAKTISDLGYTMAIWGEEPRFDWLCSPR